MRILSINSDLNNCPENLNNVLLILKKSKADIIFLQNVNGVRIKRSNMKNSILNYMINKIYTYFGSYIYVNYIQDIIKNTNGYKYIYNSSTNVKGIKLVDSGLCILSKHPIDSPNEIYFSCNDMNTNGGLSVVINGIQYINVCLTKDTESNKNSKIRYDQIEQIKKIINGDIPILLTGCYNIDYDINTNEYTHFINTLDVEDCRRIDLTQLYKSKKSDISTTNKGKNMYYLSKNLSLSDFKQDELFTKIKIINKDDDNKDPSQSNLEERVILQIDSDSN